MLLLVILFIVSVAAVDVYHENKCFDRGVFKGCYFRGGNSFEDSVIVGSSFGDNTLFKGCVLVNVQLRGSASLENCTTVGQQF